MSPLWAIFFRHRAGSRQDNQVHLASFYTAMQKANIVVAAGSGYLNDEFPRHARSVLRCLAWAMQRRKPTFMFGQGIGPLIDANLRLVTRRVMPRVDLIALRKARTSLPLLRSLGAPDKCICVSGYDAIELAYNRCRHDLGEAMGVNLRRARYARVTPAQLAVAGHTLRTVVEMLQVPLLPISISSAAKEHASVAELLQTMPPVAQKLTDALLTSWHAADRLRVDLISSAQKQIEAGAQIYRRAYSLASKSDNS